MLSAGVKDLMLPPVVGSVKALRTLSVEATIRRSGLAAARSPFVEAILKRDDVVGGY
jgi:hypothetical protein